MTQHRWYDKRSKRRYGRKPNTRRARGLHNRNYGKKRLFNNIRTFDDLQEVRDLNVEVVEIPKNLATIKRYIKYYNYYVNRYQLFRDKEYCIQLAMEKFGVLQKKTIIKAVKVCKYIIATAEQDE